MSDILKEGLQALCERLSAKAFPLTPHDTAEPCITLCDLQEECRALAARAAAPLPTAREGLRLDNADFTEIMAGYDSGSVTRETVMHRLNEWIRIHSTLAASHPVSEGRLRELAAKWREEAAKGKAKALRVAKNTDRTMQELTEYDSAMERCAAELERALESA